MQTRLPHGVSRVVVLSKRVRQWPGASPIGERGGLFVSCLSAELKLESREGGEGVGLKGYEDDERQW
jgi:hypothetical protein